MGAEFQFCNMRKVLDMAGSDGRSAKDRWELGSGRKLEPILGESKPEKHLASATCCPISGFGCLHKGELFRACTAVSEGELLLSACKAELLNLSCWIQRGQGRCRPRHTVEGGSARAPGGRKGWVLQLAIRP